MRYALTALVVRFRSTLAFFLERDGAMKDLHPNEFSHWMRGGNYFNLIDPGSRRVIRFDANRCVVRVEGQESVDNGKIVIMELCERFLAALIETTREELENCISGLDEISPGTLTRAARWLAWLRGAVAWLEGKWYEPHVTVSPEYELVCEWWIGDRKLTVYFSDEHAEFIKVWGPDIETEMAEGNAEDKTATLTAWQWLTS
jgi:hypothetical protein